MGTAVMRAGISALNKHSMIASDVAMRFLSLIGVGFIFALLLVATVLGTAYAIYRDAQWIAAFLLILLIVLVINVCWRAFQECERQRQRADQLQGQIDQLPVDALQRVVASVGAAQRSVWFNELVNVLRSIARIAHFRTSYPRGCNVAKLQCAQGQLYVVAKMVDTVVAHLTEDDFLVLHDVRSDIRTAIAELRLNQPALPNDTVVFRVTRIFDEVAVAALVSIAERSDMQLRANQYTIDAVLPVGDSLDSEGIARIIKMLEQIERWNKSNGNYQGEDS